MNYRPIGGDHGRHCDDGEWDTMCDSCRENALHDWDE